MIRKKVGVIQDGYGWKTRGHITQIVKAYAVIEKI